MERFVEFIKSLLLTPFVLQARPPVSHTKAALKSLHDVQSAVIDDQLLSYSVLNGKSKSERYAEILLCIENLILDHIYHQNAGNYWDSGLFEYWLAGTPELSRLTQLVPSIGRFFTPLPLRDSFLLNDKKRSISGRQHVAPSFNDIRHILNTAQVMAIAPSLKLITL